jgi:GNAT superfamily N-acetyltransferase
METSPDHAIANTGDTTAALARAFLDDPGTIWFMPDEARRLRFLRWFFGATLRYGRRHGIVQEERGRGAAIWLPPDAPLLNPLRALRLGYWQLPVRMGLSTLRRSLPATRLMDRHHRELVERRHWYLMVLGVQPPEQGTGLGSSLMLPIVRRADEEGLPCYLETGTEVNVRFYSRRGFEVVAEGNLPGGGPQYWCMRRPPADPSA